MLFDYSTEEWPIWNCWLLPIWNLIESPLFVWYMRCTKELNKWQSPKIICVVCIQNEKEPEPIRHRLLVKYIHSLLFVCYTTADSNICLSPIHTQCSCTNWEFVFYELNILAHGRFHRLEHYIRTNIFAHISRISFNSKNAIAFLLCWWKRYYLNVNSLTQSNLRIYVRNFILSSAKMELLCISFQSDYYFMPKKVVLLLKKEAFQVKLK